MKKSLLNTGFKIPVIGFGTFKCEPDLTTKAVETAIVAGYRHIDAAAIYKNEIEVGIGIAKGLESANVKRENIFVTSKLWNSVRGYDETIIAFNKTLQDLGLDYLDLYLIHWPRPVDFKDNYIEKNAESWKAMEDLVDQGKIKSIGVSNFKIHHIEELLKTAKKPIAVNQIQFHPNHTQDDLVDYCLNHDILVEGYGTLGQGTAFDSDILKQLALKYDTTIAHLCVEYSIQKGIIPLLKSVKPKRIIENLNIDIIINKNDMKEIDNLKDVVNRSHDSDDIDF